MKSSYLKFWTLNFSIGHHMMIWWLTCDKNTGQQVVTTCWSFAARLRGNGKRMRKWRERGEMEEGGEMEIERWNGERGGKWRHWDPSSPSNSSISLHFQSFSLISSQCMTFLASVAKILSLTTCVGLLANISCLISWSNLSLYKKYQKLYTIDALQSLQFSSFDTFVTFDNQALPILTILTMFHSWQFLQFLCLWQFW